MEGNVYCGTYKYAPPTPHAQTHIACFLPSLVPSVARTSLRGRNGNVMWLIRSTRTTVRHELSSSIAFAYTTVAI